MRPRARQSVGTTDRRRAFTLVELLIASSIGLLIAGGVMLLLIESTKEMYRDVADETVQQAAGDLESKLARCLRGMSAAESVVFATPASSTGPGTNWFRRIIVARGPAPGFPREEIRFDTNSAAALYFPNRLLTNNTVLLQSRAGSYALRDLYFYPSFEEDGTLDSSLIYVVFDIDDDGYSRTPGAANFAKVQRTFAVKMRNN